MFRNAVVWLLLFTAVAPAAAAAGDGKLPEGIVFETWLARWWGAEGSKMDRPVYRVARAGNGLLSLHYGLVPGRNLDDYTLPYWRIRSFLSFVCDTAELAIQVRVEYRDESGPHEKGFIPRSGVELAPSDHGLVFKLCNRSLVSPEDVTIPRASKDEEAIPLMLEHAFLIRPDDPTVQAVCSAKNVCDHALESANVTIVYEQSFNWSDFAFSTDGVSWSSVQAPAASEASAFYAWSEGMNRGYEIAAGAGRRLAWRLDEQMNRWTVELAQPNAAPIQPGETRTFGYALRVLTQKPQSPVTPQSVDLSKLEFRRVQPAEYRKPDVSRRKPVTMTDMINRIGEPKVRGLNLRGSYPGLLDDLDMLADWAANMVITSIGDPAQTAELIQHGHELGLEMLLAGRGSFMEGPPAFDAYYADGVAPTALADSHGQDEDHYYWYAIEPSRDFEADFGKPMALATQPERVQYWANCFADKWRGVLANVRQYAPDGGIWFYTPMPGIAHVDPLDYYDLFFKALAELGEQLTVFPFYYGVEYDQARYMIERWRDAGAHRAVFLPMRDFMTRPSQFIRAVTAARRGGAHGACGFSFSVGAAEPAGQWQWKSVMLAALANFPTPELDAFCLVEEPAELVEALAAKSPAVTGGKAQIAAQLQGALGNANKPAQDDAVLNIKLEDWPPAPSTLLHKLPTRINTTGKGFITMAGSDVFLTAPDEAGLNQAVELLLRFAELAADEAAR